jgi:HD superfamily phosphodiesterase
LQDHQLAPRTACLRCGVFVRFAHSGYNGGMKPIQILEEKVHALYDAKDPGRDTWADWLAANHVFVVADNASKIVGRFAGADPDVARAAALVHDIADARMTRFEDGHEQTSQKIAHDLMKDAGFSDEEIDRVVNDALPYHGCHDGQAPKTPEGKVLATADAMAHLCTGYYAYTTWVFGKRGETLEHTRAWALKKADRDFNDKIQLDEIKDECRTDYEAIHNLYSRLPE